MRIFGAIFHWRSRCSLVFEVKSFKLKSYLRPPTQILLQISKLFLYNSVFTWYWHTTHLDLGCLSIQSSKMMKLLLLLVIIAASASEIVRQRRQTQNCAYSNCNQINGLGGFIPGFPFIFGRKKREIAQEVKEALSRVKRMTICHVRTRGCCKSWVDYHHKCCSYCDGITV